MYKCSQNTSGSHCICLYLFRFVSVPPRAWGSQKNTLTLLEADGLDENACSHFIQSSDKNTKKKECALEDFLFGLVFYLFMFLGAQWVGFVLYVLMFMGGEAGVWPWF